MKATPKQFGKLLRDLRRAAGLSAGWVARYLGIHRLYLLGIEQGTEGFPSNRLISQFARIYGTDPDLLYIAIGRVPPDLHALASSEEGVRTLRQMQREATQ